MIKLNIDTCTPNFSGLYYYDLIYNRKRLADSVYECMKLYFTNFLSLRYLIIEICFNFTD